MSGQRTSDAFIYGWRAGADPAVDDPSYLVEQDFIADLSYEEQAGAIPKPSGQLVIANHATSQHDNHTADGIAGYGLAGVEGSGIGYGGAGDSKVVQSGDTLKFYAAFDDDETAAHRWTAMARNTYYERLDHVRGFVRLDFGGYVAERLSMARWTGSHEDVQISSSTEPSEAILNDLLEDECPGIDRSLLPDIEETATVFGNGTPVVETVKQLADFVGATIWARGEALRFEVVENIPSPLTIGPEDKTGSHTLAVNDDDLVNVVRVNGGTAEARDEDAQEVIDHYEDVTDAARKTVQLDTSKSGVPRVDLYVENNPADEGDITVRIQRDDAGAPRDVADSTKDIARTTKSMAEFPYSGSWATFRLPNHDLTNPDPWLIVESDGAQGVGVDALGNLAYRFYYEYPLALQYSSQTSIDRYGRRETVVDKTDLPSRGTVRDVAVAEVARRSEPNYELRFEAASDRARDLRVGDGVILDREMDAVDGEWVIQGVSDTWDNGNLKTTIRAVNKETF